MTGPLLALVGPTASGKTAVALAIAEALDAEIVSVDSMLLYRGLDIGTAKPTPAERARVPHHLVDIADPGEAFSVQRYQELARVALAGIAARGRRALLVGGSGLYFRAVVDDLEFPATDPDLRAALEAEAEREGQPALYARLAATDPIAASRIEPGNVRRTVRALEVAAVTGRPFSSFGSDWGAYPSERVRAVGVLPDRAAIDRRIEARVRSMVDAGFVDEVRGLLARGGIGRITAGQAIGYADVARHLAGETTIEDAIEATVRRTRALARRQIAWFRRDPRVEWIATPDGAEAVAGELLDRLAGRAA
ncbi:MAG: tRNA (adenosine(37)-N6)-dimethylallyltransferase MiaA [Actinomycetota bacterium]